MNNETRECLPDPGNGEHQTEGDEGQGVDNSLEDRVTTQEGLNVLVPVGDLVEHDGSSSGDVRRVLEVKRLGRVFFKKSVDFFEFVLKLIDLLFKRFSASLYLLSHDPGEVKFHLRYYVRV